MPSQGVELYKMLINLGVSLGFLFLYISLSKFVYNIVLSFNSNLCFLKPAVTQFPTQVNSVFILAEIFWEFVLVLLLCPRTGPAQITPGPRTNGSSGRIVTEIITIVNTVAC